MKINRIMIAAPKSGSGKTMITCALLWALKERGWQTASYKCGPDYIDPMFHREVIGIPAKNLDTFFTGEEQTRDLFLQGRTEKDFAVLEGVMGLFDGLGGIREEGSSYHLACVTGTPIVLVVDARGMGRSVLPLLAGFLAYDKQHLIRGVILNRISGMFYETIRAEIEKELDISVLGYFPVQKGLAVESRHLGLKLPEENVRLKERMKEAAAALEQTVSLDKLVSIAEQAEPLMCSGTDAFGRNTCAQEAEGGPADKPVIAVARDEAFCFYYEDNLRLLQSCGAELVTFSPLHDEKLPKGACGLLLGGGYPELYAEKLAGNEKMRRAVREAIGGGMPSVAECGGFLYLHETLADREGRTYPMAGVIQGSCQDTGKLVRFGYVELREKQSSFLPQKASIRGHEFHYYDSTANGSDCVAEKPVTGKHWECIHEGMRHWWGFPHLYYPSNPDYAVHFVEEAKKYGAGT